MRRGGVVLCVVALALACAQGNAWAHGGLRLSNPGDRATLGASPTAVQLSFSEEPEPSLSSIRVLGADGTAFQLGPPTAVPGDPRALDVRVRILQRGVYTVSWRVVSAIDGHATAGAYAFGVGVSPQGAALAVASAEEPSSTLEIVARWILLTGLAVLLGAAAAAVGGFGGRPSDDRLAAGGWLLAAAGLGLLAEAQRRYAAVSVGELLDTSVGRALAWRAVAIGAAGVALLAVRRASPRFRSDWMAAAGLAAFAAIGVHVAAGHAAAGGWPNGASVASQWAHFAAAGIWLGGLAALLVGVRGAPSEEKAVAIRRFSRLALVALVVVAATGIARAVDELSSWREIFSTSYGRAVLLKALLILALAGFGALHRRRSVPAAATDLGPLRRISQGELLLAAGALAVAAILGAIPPPAAGQAAAPPGIAVSGVDAGSTVRARLTADSPEPGPNRFVVRLTEIRTGDPIGAGRVRLRFTPLDDPDVDATALRLSRLPAGGWAGTGDNLVFDGRWRVTVELERPGGSVEIPLRLEARGPAQTVSIQRIPGEPVLYTVEADIRHLIRFSPIPERPGENRLYVSAYDAIGDEQPLTRLVVTTRAGKGETRTWPVRRLDAGRFVADIELAEGKNTLAGVARTTDGTRLRASTVIAVPGG